MAANVFKRISVNAQKAIMDYAVNFVSVQIFLNKLTLLQSSHHIFFLKNFLAKCQIPCTNDGKCIGNNKCRCPEEFAGNHCEIGLPLRVQPKCKKPCRHGICQANHQCKCNEGWFGRFCNKRGKLVYSTLM